MAEEILNSELHECIKSCQDTVALCQETLNYSLDHGNDYQNPALVRALVDCAEICQIAANFMLRNSDLYMSTCSVCAEICDSCAEVCEQHDADLKIRSCADQCRITADLCDRVSQQLIAA